MKSLKESILGSTKSGNIVIAEIIYNKLLNGEQLTEQELKWTDVNVSVFKVDKNQLKKLIRNLKYNDISLNWLDVSRVTNMSYLFLDSKYKGDISKWDVSSVTNMTGMFEGSDFNGDISKWNVSNVNDMVAMFFETPFNRNISKWNIKKQCHTLNMFYDCPIKENYKPKKLQDK